MMRHLFRKQIDSHLDKELADDRKTKEQSTDLPGCVRTTKNDLQRPYFTCFETWCVHDTSLCMSSPLLKQLFFFYFETPLWQK